MKFEGFGDERFYLHGAHGESFERRAERTASRTDDAHLVDDRAAQIHGGGMGGGRFEYHGTLGADEFDGAVETFIRAGGLDNDVGAPLEGIVDVGRGDLKIREDIELRPVFSHAD